MIYDYLEASYQYTQKDNINWDSLHHKGTSTQYNREYYSLEGCKELDIIHIPNINTIVLKGSPAYYWQGHNWTCDILSFREAINYIGTILGINIWKSLVNIFEVGLIMEVQENPKQYIKRHREGKGQSLINRPKDRGNFRAFYDTIISRKIYDPKRNIKMKQGLIMQDIIRGKGYDPDRNYIKWELHLKKVSVLNKGISPFLADMVSPEYQRKLESLIMAEYKTLNILKEIELPNDKKNLSTPDIIALELMRISINQGLTQEEVKKNINSLINDIPEDRLSRYDKDARKRMIREIFNKFKDKPFNEKYNLTGIIEEAILKKE